jgi:kynurenine formamidase
VRKPENSRWGEFGDDDELGALNYLTPEAVSNAAREVIVGQRYPLNLPMNLPRYALRPPLFKAGLQVNQIINGEIVHNDDIICFASQGSSQWDAFAHYGLMEDGVDGVFYNGIGLESVDASGYASRGGIDKIAQRGIVGRGVLIDVARAHADGGSAPLPLDHEITIEEAQSCLARQMTSIEPGDIVCFRTGWAERILHGSPEEQIAKFENLGTGITGDFADMAREQQWAAVTADNLSVELNPFKPDRSRSAHIRMMRNLGIPFGECLLFEQLSDACAADGRWTFMFVAIPLWIPGGVGSPANAMAIR